MFVLKDHKMDNAIINFLTTLSQANIERIRGMFDQLIPILYLWIYIFLLPTFLIFIGSLVLGVGLHGLLKRKPLLFKGKWIFLLIISCMLPVNLLQIPLMIENPVNLIANIILTLSSFLSLLPLLWKRLSGYMIVGAQYKLFRPALYSILDKLGFTYQKEFWKARAQHLRLDIPLDNIDADLKVSTMLWIDLGKIQIVSRTPNTVLSQVASELTNYIFEKAVNINVVYNIIYTVLGTLIISAGLMRCI